jgi:hypothetical protein
MILFHKVEVRKHDSSKLAVNWALDTKQQNFLNRG